MVKKQEKKVKIVHVKIFDSSMEDIANMSKALDSVKNSFGLDYEFLVTNEQVEVRDLRFLIKELYELYKADKELKVKK